METYLTGLCNVRGYTVRTVIVSAIVIHTTTAFVAAGKETTLSSPFPQARSFNPLSTRDIKIIVKRTFTSRTVVGSRVSCLWNNTVIDCTAHTIFGYRKRSRFVFIRKLVPGRGEGVKSNQTVRF